MEAVKSRHLLVPITLIVGNLGLGACRPDSASGRGDSTASAGSSPTAGNVPPREPASKRCRPFCKIRGHCAYDPGLNACVARDEADCRASRACRVTGLCTFHVNTCIGGKHEDCRASERCRDEGLCTFGPGAVNVCMAAKEADCRASTVCKTEGRCGIREEFCVVVKDEDCKASSGCREKGTCSLEKVGRPPNQKTRCAAMSDEDCKGAKICTDQGQCAAAEGQCGRAGD